MLQRDQIEEIVGSPLTTEREFILIGIASTVRELIRDGDTEALAHYVQHVTAMNMGLQDALTESKNQVAACKACLYDINSRVQRHDNGWVDISLRQVIHDWWSQWVNKVSS